MKKTVVVLVLLFSVFCAFSADLDGQRLALGNMKAAANWDFMTDFSNPAFLCVYDANHRMVLSAGNNSFVASPFPYGQLNGASVSFIASNMSLSLDLSWFPEKQNDGLYTLKHRFAVNTQLAYQYKDFSFGLGFSGGSESERKDIELEEKLFSGLFSETFFGRYKTVLDSESVELSAGIIYHNSGFTFGILCENIFESDSKFEVSFDSVADSIDCGFWYEMDRYNRRGRLRDSVVGFGCEFQRIFDFYQRSFNAGICYNHQFSRNFNLFCTAGADISFYDTVQESFQTLGFGVLFNPVKFTCVCEFPFGIYYSENIDRIRLSFTAEVGF